MEDKAEVIVATTAFGMGVDKPNVRLKYFGENLKKICGFCDNSKVFYALRNKD